jgi:CHAT domain-containing protein
LAANARAPQAHGQPATPAAQSAELEEAGRLLHQADELQGQGQSEAARPAAERALALYEKTTGPESEAVARTLGLLSVILLARADYAHAAPVLERALTLREKLSGPDSTELAALLDNLGALKRLTGDYARAEALGERATRIYIKHYGVAHPDVATAVNNLATLYFTQGRYDEAARSMQDVLRIMEQVRGPDAPEVGMVLNNLAEIYRIKGDLPAAEPLARRALSIYEQRLGAENAALAYPLSNLAGLYVARGDYEHAAPLLVRALTLREHALPPTHPDLALSLNNLALLYAAQGEHARAIPLYERAVAIYERVLGPEHADLALPLNNLAESYRRTNDYTRAAALATRALAIRERALGPDHLSVAHSLNTLALVAAAQGRYVETEPLLRRALAILEHALSPEHPDVAGLRANLAVLYATQGRTVEATDMLTRVAETREHNLSLLLAAGSEAQKRAYLDTLRWETSFAIAYHLRQPPPTPASAQLARLALTTILRRKGRALDAMTDQIAALRRLARPEDQTLLDQLAKARARLAALVLDHKQAETDATRRQAEIAQLTAETQRLEEAVGAIAARSPELRAELRAQGQPVTIEAVQQALPADAALVEFVTYYQHDERGHARTDSPRYAAYVLQHTGGPGWIDLGVAAPIDAAVTNWRAALVNPARTDVKALARTLDESVMRPVRRLVGASRHLLIAPDGTLNLIPFAALVDEQNKYLVETYAITYLTSGRDLLRLQLAPPSRTGPLVLANPLYDQPGAQPAASAPVNNGTPAPAGNLRAGDLGRLTFPALKGTAEEAAAVKSLITDARVLAAAQASEAALKQAHGPLLLHIATHGFFLPDVPPPAPADTRSADTPPTPTNSRSENPLLRSGLALAGANQLQSEGNEDGVLTALEAAGLDLWGTKLVVLSACETGLGEVQNGDGVYGLRRALVLAGSASQLMSLWKVNDAATRDLMVEYYRRLRAGEGRGEALRRVQLQMLTSGAVAPGDGQGRGMLDELHPGAQAQTRSHPFYWASFIQSGDWRSMNDAPARTQQQ